ncbi:MAG TPA: GNAT family N-acetyltransferase [Anaerolineales bacterium]|nr:GNAT family N-acetyltransferase [Anaerolineales bacterium]
MDRQKKSVGYYLRPATADDAKTIRRIINLVQINPTGLSWKRFVLATDNLGSIIGCGQVKPHKDGSLELASIAVLPEWRGRGVARAMIEYLLNQYPGRLYLTCRSRLEPLYRNFGFETIQFSEMPPYFQQISRLVALFNKLTHQPDHLSVMRRN